MTGPPSTVDSLADSAGSELGVVETPKQCIAVVDCDLVYAQVAMGDLVIV
jgi:hypothetical protein